MAKLIIEGELSQLLKIQKTNRLLVVRKLVKFTIEENKDQEDESSPESETLPPDVDKEQIKEKVESEDESVVAKTEEDKVEEPVIKQQVPVKPIVQKAKSKGRPKVKK